MQQVQALAGKAQDQYAGGKRDGVDGGEAGVFAQTGAAGDPRGQAGHAQACTQAAEGQRGQAQAGEPETQGCAGQDAVGHRITDQAHAPQDQKHS